jgi:glutamine synthetase
MVADASTWRVLPWAHKTGWLLCDLMFPNGKPVPFDTRALLKSALSKLAKAGYGLLAGLEVEFHIFRIVDAHLRPEDAGQPGAPPAVELLNTGYQLLSEARFDQLEARAGDPARQPRQPRPAVCAASNASSAPARRRSR